MTTTDTSQLSWTLLPGTDLQDPLLRQVQQDLTGKASILELFVAYMEALRTSPDTNATPFRKMDRLFQLGITPELVEGHHYGIPVGLRGGDQQGKFAAIDNVLELLWGATVLPVCPWSGKSFQPTDSAGVEAITQTAMPADVQYTLGINHFTRIDESALNHVALGFLNLLMKLQPAPEAEVTAYGYAKNGGHFIACKCHSVYAASDRDVYQLNYRWKALNNALPLCWLIDEIVQVADGLYLGQLLFATEHLTCTYNPHDPVSAHLYRHFGYFILFDARWNSEARRLLPALEIPVTAPELLTPSPVPSTAKFSTFTFADTLPETCRPEVYDAIVHDLARQPTIMHLLKSYADALMAADEVDSCYFDRLQELFNRGRAVSDLSGFFHGALVSWHAAGLFDVHGCNTLEWGWSHFIRRFSTWTGKAFEASTPERLMEFTGGVERGEQPTRWGANTQALRTFKQRFVGKLMQVAHVWSETVPPEEASRNGYDIKNFFFIAHQALSINPQSAGKMVYQFNYRWPKLRTIVPDCYCIDELTQIADGLYLGQLLYATALTKPYAPTVDPADYAYRQFGYFLLMDASWQQLRLQIGFDLAEA